MTKLKEMTYLPWWWLRARLGRHAPLQSVVFVSDRCNLSCKHCSIYNHKNPTTKTMMQLREELQYCYSLGSRYVDFEGGEPFLWRDGDKDINDLCDLARSLGFFSCTITTNAQMPFDGTRADSIWVSMDGVGEVHDRVRGDGAFARLEANIATCGCKALSANMVVNTLNHDGVHDAMEYVARSPYFNLISFNFHTPFPGTEYLTPDHETRNRIIDIILEGKRQGYPIMNSRTGLNRMRDMQFRKCCWMTNFVFTDGTRKDQCIGAEMGICDHCGFCMAGEESAVVSLAPDTILAGLRLRG